jgi:hypothetical protein
MILLLLLYLAAAAVVVVVVVVVVNFDLVLGFLHESSGDAHGSFLLTLATSYANT